MANTYGSLGDMNRRKGDLAQAEAEFRKALTIAEALDSKVGIGVCLLAPGHALRHPRRSGSGRGSLAQGGGSHRGFGLQAAGGRNVCHVG